MNKFLAIVGIAACSMSGFAHAGGGIGPYAGIAYGVNSDVDESKLSTQCGVGGVTCTDLGETEDAWQVYGGYPITNALAVEAGYTNLVYLAKLKGSNGEQAEQKTDGITLGLTGRKALSEKLDLYGKVGGYVWRSKVKSTAGDVKDTGVSPTVGLGVEYGINEKWSVRAGWDRFFDVGEKEHFLTAGNVGTLKDDIDTFSVGLNYNF